MESTSGIHCCFRSLTADSKHGRHEFNLCDGSSVPRVGLSRIKLILKLIFHLFIVSVGSFVSAKCLDACNKKLI